MADFFRFRDRRESVRLRMDYPALYTRFDTQGRAYDQKTSRSMNVSLGGVRLQTSFPVSQGEVLDISIALGDNLVAFRGKVIYVTSPRNQSFELGVSITDMEPQDKITLTRFIYHYKPSARKWHAWNPTC